MRVVLVSSLVCLFACGGAAQKPAETSSGDAPASSAAASTSPADEDSAGKGDAKGDSAPVPKTTTHAAAAAASDAPADAPAGAFHPAPSVTGSIDGKPFVPKVARVLAPMMKDGRIVLTLTENSTCDVQPNEAALTITAPWQNGYKADFGSMKRATKKAAGEVGMARPNAANKKEFSSTFKPTGTVTIVSAPMAKDATGKMKIDMQAGDYILAGDLDVLVCVAPK